MHVKFSSDPTKGDAVIELRFLTSSLIYLPCDFTEPLRSDCSKGHLTVLIHQVAMWEPQAGQELRLHLQKQASQQPLCDQPCYACILSGP